MKSFSQKTKEPLINIENASLCCMRAELFGMLLFAGNITGSSFKIVTESPMAAEKFCSLLKGLFDFSGQVKKDGKFYSVFCNEMGIVAKCLYSLRLCENNIKFRITPEVVEKDCCKKAFLRGAFLGGGTVIDPNKNYNMEFLTRYELLTDDFLNFLKELGFDLKKVRRKGSWVVYVKNSETICDMLSYLGATASYMEYVNIKIEREVRNDFVRISNSEIANMDKVFTASAEHIKAISLIDEKIGLSEIPEDLSEIAKLRLQNRDLSLEKLGKLLNPPLSKSGVNHRMKRLLKMAENL
ncbi:MAG: DNA-binding protein WhiA [Ruminococcaceae bacterium]|nr:DNA-binding protein WhiA [Oscillospiraceae bacterium]